MSRDLSRVDLWRRIKQEHLLETPAYKILRETHHHPDLVNEIPFFVLEAPDWVNIIALDTQSPRDPKSRFLVVRQYRVGAETVTLEIPGGRFDTKSEDPCLAAKRELFEETGAKAQSFLSLGWSYPNPAFIRNRIHTFLALGCTLEESQKLGDGSEVLEAEWFPLSQRYDLLTSGKIRHSLVMSAIASLEAKLQNAEFF